MSLKNYALTTLASAKAFMGKTNDDIQAPVISLYNSSTIGTTAATCQVLSGSIRLIVTGGVNADDTSLVFTDADKNTLTKLVTYITGTLGKGWVAEVIASGTQASTDLTLTDTTGCFLFANKETLYAPNNLYIESLINTATDFMENYCGGRRFKKTTYTDELIDGNGTQMLFTPQMPIISITSIYRHYVFTDDDLYDSDYYKVYLNEGYIYRNAGWILGMQNIKITYIAGYDFDTDGIPPELENICNTLVSMKYESVSKMGIKSEKIGQYSVTYLNEELPPAISGQLNLWRKPYVL